MLPFLTPFITVVTGSLVFMLGHICLKIIIEPYAEQQKVISEIAYSLIFYGNVSCRKPEDLTNIDKANKISEAQQKYRALAGQLVAVNMFVRGYGFWRYFLFAPSRENIKIASTGLIGLSNSFYTPNDSSAKNKYHKIIMEALDIQSSYRAID
jgi:hypothetical protein